MSSPASTQGGSSLPARPRGGSRLSRYRAERLLRKDFAGLRAKVLAVVSSQLRAKGVALDPADLEACYAQAWHGLYARVLEGEVVENPSAWLVTVTFRRAIDEYRSAGRIGIVGDGEMGSFPREEDGQPRDLAAELDDRMRLRQVFEALRTRLSARECEAASLCYLQGLSRAEAAQRMNISGARMRKLMEGGGPARPGVAGKVGELLETIKAGGWCERQSSLMRAYAFGILDPGGERYALAVAHCRECPACRAHVASLRGLASVLPLPLLPSPALGGATNRGTTRAAATTKASSGISGSFAAKFSVIAVAVLGAGYGVWGGRAHGSTPTHRVGGPTVDVRKSRSYAPRTTLHLAQLHPVHARSARVKRPSSRAQAPAGRTTRVSRPPSSYEFAPERVGGEAQSATAPRSSRGAEFGFE